MNYGAKYYGSFKDYYDRTVLITIYEKDYSGASSEMKLAGAAIEYNGSDQNIYEPVISSGLTVNVVSETDFQYISLYSANAKKYKIIVTIDTVTHWTGYVVPDMFNEPYTCTPYISQIVATDGLKALESEDFDLSELHTQFEILQHILDKIDDLNIKEAINIYEENHNYTTGDTPLKQTYVDCEVYAEMNCYEVLLDILNNYGARIYQKGGEWWIVSLHEFSGELIYRDSDAGTDSTYNPELLIGYSNDDKLANVDQQLNILPGWKKFTVIINLGFNDSILKNSDFDDWTITSIGTRNVGLGIVIPWFTWEPQYWDVVATNYLLGNGVNDYFIDLYGNQAAPNTYYVSQSLSSVFTLGTQRLKFRLNYRVTNPLTDADPSQFWIKVEVKKGSLSNPTEVKYLNSDGDWSSSETFINIENITPVNTNGPFQDFVFVANGIPEGYMVVSVYLPDKNYMDISALEVKMLSVYGFDYPEEITYEKQVNINNNYIPDDLNLYTGDYPDIGNIDTKNPSSGLDNEKFVYKGGFYLDADKNNITKQWQTRAEIAVSGFTDADQLHKIVSKAKEFLSIPQWALTGSIMGQNLVPDMCIVDHGVNNKKYLFSNGVFDLQSAQVNGTFIEVGSYSGADWILEDGTWNDDGIWIDDETWNDSDPTP